MNIFYLHRNPRECAEMHCNKHVVQMIRETAQMLSTAHRLLSPAEYCEQHKLHKAAFINHPSTDWARKTSGNYLWLSNLFEQLLAQYYIRYGCKHEPPRQHDHARLMQGLSRLPLNIPDGEFYQPPQCMPKFLHSECSIDAYRKYYHHAKARFAKWTEVPVPEWWQLS